MIGWKRQPVNRSCGIPPNALKSSRGAGFTTLPAGRWESLMKGFASRAAVAGALIALENTSGKIKALVTYLGTLQQK